MSIDKMLQATNMTKVYFMNTFIGLKHPHIVVIHFALFFSNRGHTRMPRASYRRLHRALVLPVVDGCS